MTEVSAIEALVLNQEFKMAANEHDIEDFIKHMGPEIGPRLYAAELAFQVQIELWRKAEQN